jgi:hypothetical protein
MKKHLIPHIKYYTILGFIQIIALIVLISLTGNKSLQIAVILTSGFSYIVLAILHHHLHHSLSSKIVLEYVLFGIFGTVVSLLYIK